MVGIIHICFWKTKNKWHHGKKNVFFVEDAHFIYLKFHREWLNIFCLISQQEVYKKIKLSIVIGFGFPKTVKRNVFTQSWRHMHEQKNYLSFHRKMFEFFALDKLIYKVDIKANNSKNKKPNLKVALEEERSEDDEHIFHNRNIF